MRIRILKPMSGVLEGVSLSYLAPGLTYDVDPTLGRYLICCAAATEITSNDPVLSVPLDCQDFAHLTGGVTVTNANLSSLDGLANDKPTRIQFRKRT